jgi:hypothetical protein
VSKSRYEVASLDELERLPVVDGQLEWRPIRRHFDIRAFGANAYFGARAGSLVVEEHSERGGHQELYVVVTGRATFTVDGQELDAPAGTLVFVRPGTRRVAVAADDGTTVLVLGAKAGEPFTPSPWETVFAAYAYRSLGDAARGRRLVEEEAAKRPDDWQGPYHLACFAALDGDAEAALAHLRRAVAMDPDAARFAAEDEDFAALRDDPRFAELVSRQTG